MHGAKVKIGKRCLGANNLYLLHSLQCTYEYIIHDCLLHTKIL